MLSCKECGYCKGKSLGGPKRKKSYHCIYTGDGRREYANGSNFIGMGDVSFNNELEMKTSPHWCPLRKCNYDKGNLTRGIVFEPRI